MWDRVDGVFVWPGNPTGKIQVVRYVFHRDVRVGIPETNELMEIPFTQENWDALERTLHDFVRGPGLSLWRNRDLVHLDERIVTVEERHRILLQIKRRL